MSLPFTQFLIKKKKKNRVFFLDSVCLDMLKIFKLFHLGGDVSRHEPIIKISLPKPACIREAFIRNTGNLWTFTILGVPPPFSKVSKVWLFLFFFVVFLKKFFYPKIFFRLKTFSTQKFFQPKNSFNPKIFSWPNHVLTKKKLTPKIFFTQKNFLPKKINPKNLFDPKFFHPYTFFPAQNLFLTQTYPVDMLWAIT